MISANLCLSDLPKSFLRQLPLRQFAAIFKEWVIMISQRSQFFNFLIVWSFKGNLSKYCHRFCISSFYYRILFAMLEIWKCFHVNIDAAVAWWSSHNQDMSWACWHMLTTFGWSGYLRIFSMVPENLSCTFSWVDTCALIYCNYLWFCQVGMCNY